MMVFTRNGKVHVSAYGGHHQVLTTFLLEEFYIICLNHVAMLISRIDDEISTSPCGLDILPYLLA